MAQSFWMFCAEGNGKKVRQAQRGAAAQSSARHVVDRYNKFRREGKISAEGGGRVKAYEKEVLQNLAIWLARGASHFSAEVRIGYHDLLFVPYCWSSHCLRCGSRP